MTLSLNTYRENRDALLAKIVQTFSNDERFVAAWLTGSISRNEADAVSDLDLTLVVSESHSETLCKKNEQVSAQTTPERFDLFSHFGSLAMIHENNYNAPEGGTFTFTLYAESQLMVDWIFIPQNQASRPAQALVLFEKSSIPLIPSTEPEPYEQRIKEASERVAFFWMMMAVTAKYIVRQDGVFVAVWLEELNRIIIEVDRLIAGHTWKYKRGTYSQLQTTSQDQKQAIYKLGEQMESRLPELVKMCAYVLPSPLHEIKALLDLASDK